MGCSEQQEAEVLEDFTERVQQNLERTTNRALAAEAKVAQLTAQLNQMQVRPCCPPRIPAIPMRVNPPPARQPKARWSIIFAAHPFSFFRPQSQNLSQGALGQVQAANRHLETLSKESEAALRKLCEGVQTFNTISQILTSLDKVNEM